MAWVKIDDQFPEHPKVAAAGPLAMAMQVAGLCYCNRKLTDGFIPRSIARTLLDWQVDHPDGRVFTVSVTSGFHGEDVDADWVIELLVSAGMWEQVAGGYRIHDYHDYQPSKDQLEAGREAKREAGRKGGRASAQARATANGQAGASALDEAESKPVPVPVPESSSSSSSASDTPPASKPSEDERVQQVWQEIARRKLAVATNVKNAQTWKRKVIANDRDELADEAVRLVAQYPSINVSQLAGCLMGDRQILRLLPRAIGGAS
jgi:hypothetical protein